MTDTTLTPPATTDAPPAEAPATGTDLAAEVEKWKALARKHEARAKDNSTAAQRLAEIEEAQKSEAQKLADRLAAAEAKAQAAELKALRADVAAAKGVPAGLLTGTTQEELEAAADALIAFRGEAPKLPPAPPATGQGNVGKPIGDGKADQLTREDLAGMSPEDIVKAKAAGRLNALLGIK